MNRPLKLSALIATVLRLLAWGAPSLAEDPFASAVRPTDARTPAEEQESLHVPPGFRVQLFASEPEIQKPLNMAFDSRGRLWVSGTVDYPFPDLEHPGDSIRILEDTDHDGRADRVTKFVENIPLPMGLLPYRDGVIAFSLPYIWFFRDTDGDGICDQREKLYGPFDYSKDTHGLNNAFRRGFDGWIYACHGFNNHSTVSGKDGNKVDMPSGNTYRFRPDGSRIERYSFGQINPFGMTFDARGDLYDSDCHTKPLMLILQEGQYQGFGRKHDGLGFVPEICAHSHGSTAIAGVTQATDERFPEEFRDHFFEGNVMTSRVNRDTLAYTGSSMKAVEESDFLISDDPWFRPVDLQMGPDGALYIADFYNKIIGHYEVPLTHPERDRHRGRIWRVEYVGDAQNSPAVSNLETAPLAELVQTAGSRNLPRRMKAIDEISDRLGAESAPELLHELSHRTDETSHISLLWALQRMQKLPAAQLLEAARSESVLIRIHAQRILADRPEWTPAERQAAQSGLDDSDPFVKRAAAAALSRHPQYEQIALLLKHWQATPQDDPMLAYQLKIALRSQLRESGMLTRLQKEGLPPEGRAAIAEVCLAVDTHEAASFILAMLADPQFIPEQMEQLVERMARWVSLAELQQLIQALQSRYADDLEMQLALLQRTRQGLQLQNVKDTEQIRGWGNEVFRQVLESRAAKSNWTVTTTPIGAPSPWDYESRASVNDRKPVKLLSSLPGGEQAISSIRSPEFVIPEELSFLLCGHLGFPQQPAENRNFVRLCLADSGNEVVRAYPPRNDVAQVIHWDLKAAAGKTGYLEAVDGLDLGGYAWLAFGNIMPEVVPLPPIGFAAQTRLLRSCSELAAALNLTEQLPALQRLVSDRSLDRSVRAAAAQSIASFQKTPISAGLAALWKVPTLTRDQLEETLPALVDPQSNETSIQLLGAASKTAATRFQVEIAQAIVSRESGADLLLLLCEADSLSPRVLESSVIRPQLESTQNPEILNRMQQMLDKLPPASAEREERIKGLIQSFVTRKSRNADAGQKVFEARCAACHQIKGVGKIIGPQLDGIGSRGVERLFEDVIDPNRNVDHAFRSRTYALENGQIYSGIFRRQDGPLIVIADGKGEEHSFAESEIDEQAVSNVSIMPDNWAEIIPEDELISLMAYLLKQKK